jgi:hypothetical protein
VDIRVGAVERASLRYQEHAFYFQIIVRRGIQEVANSPQCTHGHKRNGDYGDYVIAHLDMVAKPPKNSFGRTNR